jgi:hypothetical protein
VSSDSWILVPGIRIVGDELDVDVEELHCILTTHVPWIGLQKTIKFWCTSHEPLKSLGFQISISNEGGPQLTPGIEHRFVDGIAIRTEFRGGGIERDAVADDGDEDSAFSLGQGVAHHST